DTGVATGLMDTGLGAGELPRNGRGRDRAGTRAARLGDADTALVDPHGDRTRLRAGGDRFDVDAAGHELIDLRAARDEVDRVEVGDMQHEVWVADVDSHRVQHVLVEPFGLLVTDLRGAHVDRGVMHAA